MNGLFILITILSGFLSEFICRHYLSLFGVAPNALLLLTLSFGFILGPLQGAVLGFIWGLMADSMGSQLFGLSSFVLTLFGYLAGKLKRRFDAERAVPQIVIASVSTLANAFMSFLIYRLTEEMENAVAFGPLIVEVIMNGLLAAGIFWISDRWVEMWQIERDLL